MVSICSEKSQELKCVNYSLSVIAPVIQYSQKLQEDWDCDHGKVINNFTHNFILNRNEQFLAINFISRNLSKGDNKRRGWRFICTDVNYSIIYNSRMLKTN